MLTSDMTFPASPVLVRVEDMVIHTCAKFTPYLYVQSLHHIPLRAPWIARMMIWYGPSTATKAGNFHPIICDRRICCRCKQFTDSQKQTGLNPMFLYTAACRTWSHTLAYPYCSAAQSWYGKNGISRSFEQYTQTVTMKGSNNCIMIERFVAELDTT
jgi:hypothetical protein